MKPRKKNKKNRRNIKAVSMDLPVDSRYVNRELSWLEFNKRVLQQALDGTVPLLERVKFLCIYHSNLDEFYMKRLGLIRRQVLAGAQSNAEDKLSWEQQYLLIQKIVREENQKALDCFANDIKPKLKSEGIELLSWKELAEKEQKKVTDLFRNKIFPVLTPLAVDSGHPFPFISNLSTSLAVQLIHPEKKDFKIFSRIKIPKMFPSMLCVDEGGKSKKRWISLIDVIVNHVGELFPAMDVVEVMPFRVTRTIDVESQEEGTDDLLETIEMELKQRRFGDLVKLEYQGREDSWLLQYLLNEFELFKTDCFQFSDLVDFSILNPIANIKRPNLKFPRWEPVIPHPLSEDQTDFFKLIRDGDRMVHHPYESFTATVEKFINSSAKDPKVRAIKMTLYRTTSDGSLVRSLIEAAERGKEVVCLIEITARLDEENNINWAYEMEEAGVHVVYGVVGLKTHCKVALVVREEAENVVCYAHIGTGNYHAGTAKLYTDIGIFTCGNKITREVVELFNFLTGHSLKKDYQHLLVAPFTMKERLLNMIEREARIAQSGQTAKIIFKCNNLQDKQICEALYMASQAGVSVDLMIRGICVLKPGVPGMSDRITVKSIVDRFLEHTRIFYFSNGSLDSTQGEYFIGSADLMERNLHGRVEVVLPVECKEHKQELGSVLEVMWADKKQTWAMKPDGSYERSLEKKTLSGQQMLMQIYLDKSKRKIYQIRED